MCKKSRKELERKLKENSKGLVKKVCKKKPGNRELCLQGK